MAPRAGFEPATNRLTDSHPTLSPGFIPVRPIGAPAAYAAYEDLCNADVHDERQEEVRRLSEVADQLAGELAFLEAASSLGALALLEYYAEQTGRNAQLFPDIYDQGREVTFGLRVVRSAAAALRKLSAA